MATLTNNSIKPTLSERRWLAELLDERMTELDITMTEAHRRTGLRSSPRRFVRNPTAYTGVDLTTLVRVAIAFEVDFDVIIKRWKLELTPEQIEMTNAERGVVEVLVDDDTFAESLRAALRSKRVDGAREMDDEMRTEIRKVVDQRLAELLLDN